MHFKFKPSHSMTIGAALALFWVFMNPLWGLYSQDAAEQPYTWHTAVFGGGGFVSGLVTDPESKQVFARTDVGGVYAWNPADQTWTALCDWIGPERQGLLGAEALAIPREKPSRLYIYAGISYLNQGQSAILRSDDAGKTFQVLETSSQFKAHANGMGRQNGERLAVLPGEPDHLLLGTRRDGLFQSRDGGSTWQKVAGFPLGVTPNDNGICLVLCDPVRPGRVYAGLSRTGDNLFVSNDSGITWKSLPERIDPDIAQNDITGTDMPQRACLDAQGRLLVTFSNGAGPHASWQAGLDEAANQGSVWRFDPASASWQDISPSYRGFGGIAADPADPDRLICSTINTWAGQAGASGDQVYLSHDGGITWTDVFSRGLRRDTGVFAWAQGHAIHWAGSIAFDPADPQAVWITSGNGVWRCDNIEADLGVWRFQVRGLEEMVPLDALTPPGGGIITAVGDYDGFVQSDPSLPSPIFSPQIGTTTSLAQASLKPDILVRCGGGDDGRTMPLWHSSDAGKTWSAFKSRPVPTQAGTVLNQGWVALSADASSLVWAPKRGKTLYVTADWGKTWSAVQGIGGTELRPVADQADPQIYYIYERKSGQVYRSGDGGQNFALAGKAGKASWGHLRSRPGKAGELWLPLESRGLVRSVDGGAHWEALQTVRACTAIGFGAPLRAGGPDCIYIWGSIGGVPGLYRSADLGLNWVCINDEAHQYGGPGNGLFVLGDRKIPGRVYMSSPGRGLVYGDPAP